MMKTHAVPSLCLVALLVAGCGGHVPFKMGYEWRNGSECRNLTLFADGDSFYNECGDWETGGRYRIRNNTLHLRVDVMRHRGIDKLPISDDYEIEGWTRRVWEE